MGTCKPKVNVEKGKCIDIEEIAKEYFTEGFEIIPNERKSFSLVTKSRSAKNNDAFPNVESIVIDNETGTILFRNKTMRGNVVWLSDHVIRITSISGIPEEGKENEPKIQKIDIQKLKDRLDISNSNKDKNA